MTWSQKDHDHLIFSLGEIETLAFTSIREKDAGKRRQLAKELRAKLETVNEIAAEARNAGQYIAQRIAWLEDK